jgi:CheY-like chemotaxis protein
MLMPDTDVAGKVVLLAEDETLVRRYVRHVLTKLGFHVMDAADGEEALNISRRHPGRIDLLVTNVKMPRMEGIELAKTLQQERPDVKVIIISGHTSGRLAELAGRTEFVEKPFLPDVLTAKIREVLQANVADPAEV